MARRLALIEKNTCISNWRHVAPTKQNPADLVSRETTPAALVRSEIWLTGPEFLKDDPRNWPDPGVACCDVDHSVFEKSSNALAFAVVDEEVYRTAHRTLFVLAKVEDCCCLATTIHCFLVLA